MIKVAIEFYKEFGPLGYLANYSNHGFFKDGVFYKTVEHYYQSEKYSDPLIKAKIINAETPKIASNIGRDRNNIRISDFKQIKNQVMFEGILEKFRQNREIAYKLIATGNESIAEATIDEYYWGIGKDKTGENNIGKIIEKVRTKLKEEILSNILTKSKKAEVVYIIGPKILGIDAVFSGYLLSKILKSLGINAKFAVLEESTYKESDKDTINSYLSETPEIINNLDNNFILVNSNTLDSLDLHNVLGAFDHHPVTGEIPDTLGINYSSTSLLIYDLFKQVYNFSDYEKKIIYLTCLSDEHSLNINIEPLDNRLLESLKLKIS